MSGQFTQILLAARDKQIPFLLMSDSSVLSKNTLRLEEITEAAGADLVVVRPLTDRTPDYNGDPFFSSSGNLHESLFNKDKQEKHQAIFFENFIDASPYVWAILGKMAVLRTYHDQLINKSVTLLFDYGDGMKQRIPLTILSKFVPLSIGEPASF